METKELNLVEILKDCPKDTELYSTVYGPVKLIRVVPTAINGYPIGIRRKDDVSVWLTSNGHILHKDMGECILFPSKEQHDWSKFVVPYTPKFGDFVRIEHPDTTCYKRNYVISIFPDKEVPNKTVGEFFNIACIDMDGNLLIPTKALYNHGHIKRASEEEKQELLDMLAKVGKRWNAETKTLENIRWRAEEGEGYYFINTELVIARAIDHRDSSDEKCHKEGNYFQTPGAANRVLVQIKDIFNNSKA